MTMKFGMGAAIAVAMTLGSVGVASAQDAPAKKVVVVKKHTHGTATREAPHTLTVSRGAAPAAVGLSTPVGLAGSLVTAPLSGLSQAFGMGGFGGPSKPLPIVARYSGAGPVTDSVNQGWAQPVPLTANGPVYKLESVANAGSVSPFEVIAAPITAATTLAGAPLDAAGAIVGAPAAPAPVF